MNLSNIKEKVSRCKNAVVGGVVGTSTVLGSAVTALAAESGGAVNSAMSAGFTAVQTDFDSAVTVIAPIAMAIFATFTVWRLALRFFKTTTGKS